MQEQVEVSVNSRLLSPILLYWTELHCTATFTHELDELCAIVHGGRCRGKVCAYIDKETEA